MTRENEANIQEIYRLLNDVQQAASRGENEWFQRAISQIYHRLDKFMATDNQKSVDKWYIHLPDGTFAAGDAGKNWYRTHDITNARFFKRDRDAKASYFGRDGEVKRCTVIIQTY